MQSQSLQPIFLLRVKDRFRAFETLIKRLDDLLTFPSSTCQLERIPRELDIRRLSMYTRREFHSFEYFLASDFIAIDFGWRLLWQRKQKAWNDTRLIYISGKKIGSVDRWEIGEAIPLVQETNKREMAEEEDSR